MSEVTQTLASKLAEVMGEVGYVQKDAENAFHHYKYASAEAVLKKVNAALSTRGIAVSTQAELLHYDQLPGDKGPSMHAVVRLSLMFIDGSGDTITAQGIGEGSDKGDKAVMKGNTAAVKYALADAFMISWGDDPEADAHTDANTMKRKSEPNPFTGETMNPIETPLPEKGTKGINAVRELLGFAEVLGWSTDKLLSWVEKRTGGKVPDELTMAQAKALLEAMKKEAA